MTRRLVIYPQAERDLLELAEHIARQSAPTSERFLQAVWETLQFLLEFPSLGSPWESENPRLTEMRFHLVRGFPNHVIFYLAKPETLEVVHVLHGSRNLRRIFGS